MQHATATALHRQLNGRQTTVRTVLTQDQECWVHGAKNGKGTHIWRLRQEKPELFESLEKTGAETKTELSDDRPSGFDACQFQGWLYSKDKRLFFEQSTGLFFWVDEGGVCRPLREGTSHSVSLSCGACAIPGIGTAVEGGSQPYSATKRITISDLHAAAKALHIDIGHFDRPAGVLAIVGAVGTNAAPPDAAARALPEKLLRHFAAFRGEWTDEMLGKAITSAFMDVASGLGGLLPGAAVALLVGQRLVAAAAPGTCFSIAAKRANSTNAFLLGDPAAPLPGEAIVTRCCSIGDNDAESLFVSLSIGDLAVAENIAIVAAHLPQSHPRAACIALLKDGRAKGACGSLAVACASLFPRQVSSSSAGEGQSSSRGGPPAKRQKTDGTGGKVRLRQILLRHAFAARRTDPVRGNPVKRTLEEAERQMLGVLESLMADNCKSFASTCKAISECQSALKGGDMAGDVGWLDQKSADVPPEKALRLQVPALVLKPALELAVGELGDIVTSDLGVHLIQRIA